MNTNHVFRLKSRPKGTVQASDFSFNTEKVESPTPEQVLVQVKYLSIDPTNRIWMSDMPQYMEPVAVGEVMRGLGIGIVHESRSKLFKKGDLVSGSLGWQEYSCVNAQDIHVLPDWDVPLDAHMGPLGMTGWTAYFGLLNIGDPKPGETVVISAAAGAVGSIVGQIAKIKGCRVIGIAGSDEKCTWLQKDLKFDGVINYKKESLGQALDLLCPKGIDVYFENVGGTMLDSVLPRMNLFGRIPLCGLISSYNSTTPVPGPAHFSQILMKRLKVQGFIVSDFGDLVPKACEQLAAWLKTGKIKYHSTVIKGLEKAPEALNMLFSGDNVGKLFIEL